MTWTAILALAAGAYLLKALGVLVLGPLAGGRPDPAEDSVGGRADVGSDNGSGRDRPIEPVGGWPLQLGQLLPPALLAALVVNQTVASGQQLVIDARLAGVVAGAVAVRRGAQFWLVLVIAAATTALLRLIAG